MSVAVLHPEDCLKHPFSKQALISPPRAAKLSRNPNRTNRSPPNRRKRSLNTSPPSRPVVDQKSPAKNLVLGQVKILKRGEELSKPAEEPIKVEKKQIGNGNHVDLVEKKQIGSGNRLDLVEKKQIRNGNRLDLVEKRQIGSGNRVDLALKHRSTSDPIPLPSQTRLTESKNKISALYAGSGCFTSPPPSSVPLPAFFMKKCAVAEEATTDLKRILRLDL